MGASKRAALGAVVVGALALSGCPVDERSLGDGRQSVVVAGAGGEGFADVAGASGQAGAGDVIGSWGFDRDTAEWQPESGVEQSWSSVDAGGSAHSGSLLVTNAAVAGADAYHTLGSTVCLSVAAGVTYDVSAAIGIVADQNTGAGGFVVEFFNVTGCTGRMLKLVDYLTVDSSSWVLGEKSQQAPDGSESALFRLVASKLGTDPPFTVRFDDVRFQAE